MNHHDIWLYLLWTFPDERFTFHTRVLAEEGIFFSIEIQNKNAHKCRGDVERSFFFLTFQIELWK